MDQSESSIHSFIIRIWSEEDRCATWRGSITHVPSGERRYLQELDDIIAFIVPYLKEMGVKVGKRESLIRWIKKRMKQRKNKQGTGKGRQNE